MRWLIQLDAPRKGGRRLGPTVPNGGVSEWLLPAKQSRFKVESRFHARSGVDLRPSRIFCGVWAAVFSSY